MKALLIGFTICLCMVLAGCATVRAGSTGLNKTVQALVNDTEATMKALTETK